MTFVDDIYDFLNSLANVATEYTKGVPKFTDGFQTYTAANWVIRLGRKDTFVRILIYQMLMSVSTFSPRQNVR